MNYFDNCLIGTGRRQNRPIQFRSSMLSTVTVSYQPNWLILVRYCRSLFQFTKKIPNFLTNGGLAQNYCQISACVCVSKRQLVGGMFVTITRLIIAYKKSVTIDCSCIVPNRIDPNRRRWRSEIKVVVDCPLVLVCRFNKV